MGTLRTALPLFLLCAALPALADIELHGRVLDDTGAPIAGARVLLYRMSAPAGEGRLAETLSDGEGAWTLTTRSGDLGVYEPEWTLLTLAAGRAYDLRLIPDPYDGVLDIVLPPEAEISGTVLGPDGAPVEGARVAPHTMPTTGGDQPAPYRAMPPDIAGELVSVTGPDGRYRIGSAPGDVALGVTYEAPGRGCLLSAVRGTGQVLRFVPVGSLRGRIAGGATPSEFAGLTVEVRCSRPAGDHTVAGACATVDELGGFAFPELPVGTYRVSVQVQHSSARHVRGPDRVVVQAGQESSLELRPEPTVPIRGRMIDEVSGDPVPNALLMVYVPGTSLEYVVYGRTGDDGTFEARFVRDVGRPPVVTCQGQTAAGARVFGQVAAPLGPEGTDLGDVGVLRVLPVEVQVSDLEGNPVAGAVVLCESNRREGRWTPGVGLTDARGVALLHQVYGPVTVTARMGDQVAAVTWRIDPASPGAPRIALTLQHALR